MPLTPKAFDVLRYVVEHADRVVTHDELLEAIWPQTYVNPEGIRKYVLEIRKVLGDQRNPPFFIETLPKRGYRFIAKVSDERKAAPSGAIAGAAGDMVGRAAALAQLAACLKLAADGQRQIVFVTGEAGIGKTTLVDMFQQYVHGQLDVRIARGQCIEGFGGIEAYYPMLEAVGSLLQQGDDDSLVRTLAKRAPTWLIQFPALVKPEQREPLQREILGSTRERMVREFCETLEAITAQTPLVVILEDLHWVDPSTLDLISALARRREPARLLLLATYRPVDVVLTQSPLKPLKQDLLVRRLCHEIAIERLEESEVADYLTKSFRTDNLPAGLATLIHQNSGGNPLFMVAIVQDLVKKGMIADERGQLRLNAPVEEVYPGIPETLQQMLEIQLEQLNPEERRALQCGCVVGEHFSVWAVAAMLGEAAASIEEVCDRLAARQQFIRCEGIHAAADGSPSARYEFRHSLYRQALYRSLTGLNRSTLHLRLGEKLMAVCDAGKSELASELALHFEEGRDHARAARCLMLAAENTAKRFSYRDTVRVLRHALELMDDLAPDIRPELEVPVLQRMGDAHYALGEMYDSAVAYEGAARVALKADSKPSQLCALVHSAAPLWYIDADRGNEVCQQALAMSKDLADPLLAAQTQLAAASFRLLYDAWREEDAEICTRAEQTLRTKGKVKFPGEVFYVYVQAIRGNYEDAARQAETLVNTTTNPTARVLASGANGLIQLFRGRFGEVRKIVRSGREGAEKNGETPWMYIFGDAWLRLLCFDFQGVQNVSMRVDAEEHAAWTRTVARIASGYAAFYQGRTGEALEHFAQVRDFQVTPRFFLHWHWRMHAALGTIEALLGAEDIASAGREAGVFLESALSVADPNMRALALEIKARVARAAMDFDEARRCIESALPILEKFEIPVTAWQVHRTAWDLFTGDGDREKADRHRAHAVGIIRQLAGSFEECDPLIESLLNAPPVRRLLPRVASA
uniref:Transcriptional regulator, putative ATPase, winged helix family n=1 Tax=Solibacter usitatus (strain Ellin6076) TaxID=234267 RepID=Q022K7_SOLUE